MAKSKDWWKNVPPFETPIYPFIIGPLAGLNHVDDYLGRFPVFMFPPKLKTLFDLKTDNWPGTLQLIDSKGEIAVAYRCWWTSALENHFDSETPRLRGFQLLIRPNIYEKIDANSVGVPQIITKII